MWTDFAALSSGQWLLTAAAAVGFGGLMYAFLPPLLSFLGQTRVRFRAIDDPAAVEDVPDDETYQSLVRDLAAAGFRPLGVVVERVWFQGDEWTIVHRVRKFQAADGTAFASIYRLRDTSPWRVAIETVCDNGLLVQTAAPGVGLVQLTDHVIRTEHGELDVVGVVEQHGRVVGRVTAVGGPKPERATLARFAEVGERADQLSVRDPGSVWVFAVPLILFLIPAACIAGARLLTLSVLGTSPAPVLVETGFGFAGGLFVYGYGKLKILPALFAAAEGGGCEGGAEVQALMSEAVLENLDTILADYFRTADGR